MLERMSLFATVSEDPTELWRNIAAAAKRYPVYWDEMLGLPVVLQTAAINSAFRDSETYSTRVFEQGLMRGALVAQEGEDHTRMRKLYNSFFAPRQIKAYEEGIVAPAVRQVMASLAQRDEPDLVDHFAMLVPQQVVSALFALPMEDIAKNDELVRRMLLAIVRPLDESLVAAGNAAYETMSASLREIAARELEHPSDTLLGEIAKALVAEGHGDVAACERIVFTLILGSYETTIWAIASVLTSLLRHPESLARVRGDLSLLPGAIEESWRWCGSAPTTIRLVLRETNLGEQTLAAGDVISLALGAPHYDEAIHPQPERYDIERPAKTMIFGGGAHYCVGAPLARMETRVAMTQLLEQFPNLRLDPDRPAPTYRMGTRNSVAFGPDHLPVVLN